MENRLRLTDRQKEELIAKERKRRIIARKQQVKAQADEQAKANLLRFRRDTRQAEKKICEEIVAVANNRLREIQSEITLQERISRSTPIRRKSTNRLHIEAQSRSIRRSLHRHSTSSSSSTVDTAIRRGREALLKEKMRKKEELRRRDLIIQRKEQAKQEANRHLNQNIRDRRNIFLDSSTRRRSRSSHQRHPHPGETPIMGNSTL